MSDTTCTVKIKMNEPASYENKSSHLLADVGLLSLSTVSCGNTVKSSDRLFHKQAQDFTVLNQCAESSMITSMVSRTPFINICVCFFFMVSTTLALHHDWDVEISRQYTLHQFSRKTFFLLREENRQWIPVARGEPEVVVSK